MDGRASGVRVERDWRADGQHQGGPYDDGSGTVDWSSLWLLLAGVAAGIIGFGAGLASLVSYPALLAVGLAPVTANMSNTVALTCAALGGLATAGPELRPQRRRVIRFALAGAVGGTVGAGLLLSAPPGAFEAVVPWLVAFASLVLLARPWLRRLHWGRLAGQQRAMLVFVAVVAIYGGYFGAAAGVVLLAAFTAVFDEEYAVLNALKAMVLGAANVTASVVFVLFSTIDWSAALPLALGCLIGSAVSPPLVRRVPETPLRVAVGLAGLALAVRLHLG
jgi:hypothetical protein